MMMLFALTFITGCASKNNFSCYGWAPIYLSEHDVDVISEELARDILKHNEYGRKTCSWHIN